MTNAGKWVSVIIWVAGILVLAGHNEVIRPADRYPMQQEGNSDDLAGFEDSFEDDDPFDSVDLSIPEIAAGQKDEGPFTIGGFVKLTSEYAYNKSDEKLSKLMPELFVETEYKINQAWEARISGRAIYDLSHDIEAKDTYTGTAQDDDHASLELKDAYLDGQVSDTISLRAGRQIIAWGDSDYARITDVINPRDLTSPGLIDLEDAREPAGAIRLTMNADPWVYEAVTVHQHPGSKISGEGTDFDYFKSFRSPAVVVADKDTPGFGLDHTGVALKSVFAFNGGDISLVTASTYDDQPVLRYDGMKNGVMVFTPEYDRFTTLGLSSGLARGSILFKLESALQLDKKMMRSDVPAQIRTGMSEYQVKTTSEKDRIAALAGVEYTGFSDLRLVFETQLTYTLDHSPVLADDETELATYFQATRDFFNEVLALDLFWVTLHPGAGNIIRISGTYDLTDEWEIQAGVVFYDADTSSADLYAYTDQDRVFLRLKYGF